MNKFFSQFGKYRWLGLAGVVIIVLIVALIGVINSGNEEARGREEEVAVGAEQVEANDTGAKGGEETAGGVVFRNSKFLEDFLGADAAKTAMSAISESILNFIGDNGNYTAFVAGSDLEKGVSFPFSTMEFTAQVSNGENYFVQIALKKDAYFGVLVGPVESNEAEFFVDYLRSGAEAGYTEEEAVESLRAWASEARAGAVVGEVEVLSR